MSYTVIKYDNSKRDIWNSFIRNSKNATFLFHRDFMEYHQDRFEDFSLMVYTDTILVALLPANKVDDAVYSHQGLTYGDLIFMEALDVNIIEAICNRILEYLSSHEVKSFTIKTMPKFYRSYLSEQNSCFQMVKEMSLIKQNTILAIDFNSGFKIHKTKVKRFKKIENKGFRIKQGKVEFDSFWNIILIPRLNEKYNVSPLHSLAEIHFLSGKFENEIIQYNIYHEDEILAGITVFKKGDVVKSQYGMASVNGEKINALDMLFVFLIYKYKEEGMQYFSMGTVNDDSELGYNKGMLKQKQELGCSTYSQDILNVVIND